MSRTCCKLAWLLEDGTSMREAKFFQFPLVEQFCGNHLQLEVYFIHGFTWFLFFKQAPVMYLAIFSQITYCLHFGINLNLHSPNLVKTNLALLRNMNHIILLILFSVCYILYCFWLLWRYLWRLAGSGSSYLYALLDHEWREGMSQEEAEVCPWVPCLDTNTR